jgi:hypothetical protein
MAGLVRLCLKAALDYISSHSFYSPLTSNNHRTSSEHSFLYCSLFIFSLSHSRRVLWPWLRFPLLRYSQSLFSPFLRILITLQLGSSLIPPSPTHTLSLCRRPWTLNSREFRYLLPSTPAMIPFSTKHPRSLSTRHPLYLHPSATRLLTRRSIPHDCRLINSIGRHITYCVKHQTRSTPHPSSKPLLAPLPHSSPSLLLVSLLATDTFATIETS